LPPHSQPSRKSPKYRLNKTPPKIDGVCQQSEAGYGSPFLFSSRYRRLQFPVPAIPEQYWQISPRRAHIGNAGSIEGDMNVRFASRVRRSDLLAIAAELLRLAG
jgi:hypothetical protein